MPDVIVNTSPLQYLYQLKCLSLFETLYGQIIVPESVIQELQQGKAQGLMLPNIMDYSWMSIRKPQQTVLLPLANGLGAGESEVLALILEVTDGLAVLDDKRARRYAELMNIKTTGTLGILLKAKQIGELPELRPILEQLRTFGFRMSQDTHKAILKMADESY